VLVGGPEDREHVATHAGHVRLDDVQHRGGRDGRVHGVASILQDLQGGGRGQRLTRRGDASGGVDGRASRVGRRARDRAVHLGDERLGREGQGENGCERAHDVTCF
jgi:hypothetical protein